MREGKDVREGVREDSEGRGPLSERVREGGGANMTHACMVAWVGAEWAGARWGCVGRSQACVAQGMYAAAASSQ